MAPCARQVVVAVATSVKCRNPAGCGHVTLGELSPPSSVIWLYHTLAFAVRAIDTDVAVLPIARWLQSVAAAGG